MLIAALPVSVLGLAWLPSLPALERVMVVVVASGFPVLADQLGRAWGRRLEPRLFAEWGGKPTTQLLRWNGPVSRTRQAYQHTLLQEVVGPSLCLPTEAEETADPAAADDIYDVAATVLRSRVRDPQRTNLVFQENCNYGFRRNLLGLRPLGLASAALGLLVIGVAFALDATGGYSFDLAVPVLVLVGAADIILLWFWLGVVNKRWVEETAWAYAERLMAEITFEAPPRSPPASPAGS